MNSVMDLLELHPLGNTMIGLPSAGGMSFAQKKRVSVAVELAANPSILFLDEPTTGLDSRAAQVTPPPLFCTSLVTNDARPSDPHARHPPCCGIWPLHCLHDPPAIVSYLLLF